MSRKLLNTNRKMSREEIAENLSRIVEGLVRGEIKLSAGSNSVNLEPGDNPEFELEVEEEEEDGDISLEIEIEWNPEEGNEGELEIE